jgi:hypothetical protein
VLADIFGEAANRVEIKPTVVARERQLGSVWREADSGGLSPSAPLFVYRYRKMWIAPNGCLTCQSRVYEIM